MEPDNRTEYDWDADLPKVKELYEFLRIAQGKKICPARYKHYLKIPVFLYDELSEASVVSPVDYIVERSAFFEINELFVTLHFANYCHIDDLHIRILDYLVSKHYGKNYIQRGGMFF